MTCRFEPGVVNRMQRQHYSWGSLLIYAATLVLEVPAILLRLVLIPPLLGFALSLLELPSSFTTGQLMTYLPLAPTLWSVLALVWPAGIGWYWYQRSGGRTPSRREHQAYSDAIELLQANSQTSLVPPAEWFVLDTTEPNAAVIGDTLMLSRGLLNGPHLAAVLAHELGHLATPDGRLTAALSRLVIYSPSYARRSQEPRSQPARQLNIQGNRITLLMLLVGGAIWLTRRTIALMRGGLGLYVLRPVWGNYWRAREHAADTFAAQLGQADELADFLETHHLIHDHPIPFVWLTDHTHPATEHRIDRLRNHESTHGSSASEPVKTAPDGPPGASQPQEDLRSCIP
jgi:Zn-dependent protease with chaperone function